MVPKRQRLSRADFERVLTRGKRLHGTNLTLIVLAAPQHKCGVVVGKKTARKANARNLLRRRVYSVCAQHLPTLPLLHIAVLTRPSVSALSYSALKEELGALFAKLR